MYEKHKYSKSLKTPQLYVQKINKFKGIINSSSLIQLAKLNESLAPTHQVT